MKIQTRLFLFFLLTANILIAQKIQLNNGSWEIDVIGKIQINSNEIIWVKNNGLVFSRVNYETNQDVSIGKVKIKFENNMIFQWNADPNKFSYVEKKIIGYQYFAEEDNILKREIVEVEEVEFFDLNSNSKYKIQISQNKLKLNSKISQLTNIGEYEINKNQQMPQELNPNFKYVLNISGNKRNLQAFDWLDFSLILGSVGQDFGYSVANTKNGDFYIAGSTWNDGFPTTHGVFDTSFNQGFYDVFLAKLNEKGELLWSSLIGGNEGEVGVKLIVDNNDNPILLGTTDSENFPHFHNFNQDTGAAFDSNTFLLKLSKNGDSLLFSSIIHEGVPIDVLENQQGDLITLIVTSSSTFPVTDNSYDTTFNGDLDVTLTVLNALASQIKNATYFGTENFDRGNDLAIDTKGNILVGGFESGLIDSVSFPVTSDAYLSDGGPGFIAKFSPDLATLLYCSKIDGYLWALEYNSKDELILVERNISANYCPPIGYDTSFNGDLDIVVRKMNASLTQIIDCTYLGGGDDDFAYTITINEDDIVFLAGRTCSQDFPISHPVKSNVYCSMWGEDLFFSVISDDLKSLLFSTAFGGGKHEMAWDISVKNEKAVIVGETESVDFQTFHPNLNSFIGMFDAFVIQINLKDYLNEVSKTQNHQEINFFPNPTNGIVFFPENIESYSEITIIDLFGKVVFSSSLQKTTKSLDLSFLSNGFYFIKLNDQVIQKLIVAKN